MAAGVETGRSLSAGPPIACRIRSMEAVPEVGVQKKT